MKKINYLILTSIAGAVILITLSTPLHPIAQAIVAAPVYLILFVSILKYYEA